MLFPADLEESAHRTSSGEYAWRRDDALRAVACLTASGCAVLGGELWLVEGAAVWGSLPLTAGGTAVFHWEAVRNATETWSEFVTRSRAEALDAIADLPAPDEVKLPAEAVVFYNLTWRLEGDPQPNVSAAAEAGR
jgi:hypothetical protein